MYPLSPKGRYASCLILFLFITGGASSQNYIFAQLNGSPLNTAGWNLQGDARVTNVTGTNNSELLVCSVTGASGAAFCNQPINLSQCHKWIAEFDFRMFDGTGADGLAFCFLDTPPTGFVTGGGLGIPNSANGLKVCFDTWNNCNTDDPAANVHQDMPKIEIRWGTGYNVVTSPSNFIVGECLNEPTLANTDGRLSFIRSADYKHAKITYDSGRIQVNVNGTDYLSGFQLFNFAGYLGFTASTGGYSDNHSIKNVIIYTEMPPSFAGVNQGFCPYDTIQIGGTTNPAYTYSWYPTTGLSDPTVAAPYLHLTGDPHDAQNYIYRVNTSFKDKPGCASADSITLTVYPNPEIHFITPEICLTDAIAQFYDSSYTRDSTTLPFSYLWDFGDPNAGVGNPDHSIAKNPTHHYSAAQDYRLSLAVTNSLGCRDTTSKIFTVNGAVPLAAYTITNAQQLCSNQPVMIRNESTVDFGSITKLQIFWGDSSGVSDTDDQPYPGKLYSHSYPDPVTTGNAVYKIKMISFSGITCQNEQDQEITVHPGPHVQFNAIPVLCDYDPALVISQASELAGMQGSFSFSGTDISPAGLFDPKQSGAGNFPVLYTFVSNEGCTDSAIQSITVLAHPRVDIGNDTSIVKHQPLQLHAVSGDQNSISFLWTPATGLDNPNIPNPVANLGSEIDTIRYSVRATDSAGCYGDASIKVKVFSSLPDIFVPNAFTPGTAVNNLFRPIPVGISSLQFFRVYTRWGQIIYNSSGFGAGWDGAISGKPQAAGTYVWMVKGTTYAGASIFKKGTVTLIR